MAKWNFENILNLTLAIQVFTCVVVILDIPFARQIICFAYLAFVPGLVILRIFDIDSFNLTEQFLFSIGLSAALLMLIGLLINTLYPLVGVLKPLSTLSLMITLNAIFIPISLIGYVRSKKHPTSASLKFSPLSFLVSLPILGVIGIAKVNTNGDNQFLLLTILAVAVVVVLSLFLKKKTSGFYALVLLMIGMSLVAFVNDSFITRYVVGADQQDEFYAFRLTQNKEIWNMAGIPQLDKEGLKANAMLSDTILPLIYSQIMNLDGSWVFKILYPIFMMFAVVGLYRLFCSQTKKKTAFLASFFFISVCIGIGSGSNKQIIAQFFCVMLFIVIFKKNLTKLLRNSLFIFFGFALAVSHYTMAYLFLFALLFAWVTTQLVRKHSGKIRLSYILIFFTMTFLWSIYTQNSITFKDFSSSATYVLQNFSSNFFSPESRGTTVLTGLGLSSASLSIWRLTSRVLFILTELLISLATIEQVYLLVKRQRMRFDFEYVTLIFANFAMIVLNVILPNLSATFLVQRYYQTALLILAPLCILGCKTSLVRLFSYVSIKIAHPLPRINARMISSAITLLILIPFFLFQTGFVYVFSHDTVSTMTLGMNTIDKVSLYTWITNDQEVLGAQWLSSHMNPTALVYSDGVSRLHVLNSYGLIGVNNFDELSNETTVLSPDSFVYLRSTNVVDGIIQEARVGVFQALNITVLSSDINIQDNIYANGNCQVYKVPD